MRKILLLTSTILLAGSLAAHAADLPRRSAPPVAPFMPVFTWTGFYLGAHVGYGFAGNDEVGLLERNAGNFANFGKLEEKGVFGGVTAGYNYQLNNGIVLGIEADASLSGIEDSLTGFGAGPFGSVSAKSEIRYGGTLRGRLGYAFDRTLIFVTGGLAVADIKYNVSGAFLGTPFAISESEVQAGVTLGAGVEYAFTNNISAKVEYRYTRFESKDLVASFGNNSVRTVQSPENHAVLAGVNYRFGGPAGSVMARY